MNDDQQIAYTVTGCTPSGPIYMSYRRGTAQSRRQVFDAMRALRADRSLWDLQIWRCRYHWMTR